MMYVEKCPRCGGPVVEKEVKELLFGGNNTAFITVTVGVCQNCGERLFTPDQIRRFEDIENKLAHGATTEFHPVGKSFQVA